MTTPEPGPAAEQDVVRVLVVTTDEAAAAFLVALLERAGLLAMASPAADAAARTNSASPPFDLVLVDAATEPVRSIRSLADPVRARTPVAVLAAVGAESDAEAEAMGAGATVWIPRPIEDSQLIPILHRAAGA